MNLLYLVHRIPYPPDKGDKIRSYHWLKALTEHHDVHLATFYDDPADLVHRGVLEKMCASVTMVELKPKLARLRSLAAVVQGGPLSLRYFESSQMRKALVKLRSEQSIDVLLGYSAPMASYRRGFEELPMVMDMVDVDSAKFMSYGKSAKRPQRWVYALEGRRLAAYERRLARELDAVILSTEPEAELLRERVRDSGRKVRIEAITNGVELPPESELREFLDSDSAEPRFVFVGAMDYYANVDAVEFAARDILPRLREKIPHAQFEIVGRYPTAAVQALGDLPGVTVHGGVPDVAPFLHRAVASLVPLRIAQGIQNKVLEAMAYGRPVVTHPRIVRSLGPGAEKVVLGADKAEDYARHLLDLWENVDRRSELGRASRVFVQERFAWQPNYDRICDLIEDVSVNKQRQPA